MTVRRVVPVAAGGLLVWTISILYGYWGIVVRWPREGVDPLYSVEMVQGQPAAAAPSTRWSDPAPGWYYVGSPDGRYLALTRSTRRAYHTVFVWDERNRVLHEVVSVQEGDPGSGASHQYRWSSDSRALLISGWGSLPLHATENPLSYAYVVEQDVLYRVPKWQRID
jgi:hypothetical protein